MGLGVSWRGWAALALFALQNGLAILLIRFSKLHDTPYSSQVIILVQEAAYKLPVSVLCYACECGGALKASRNILEDLRLRPVEWLQLAVPALLYTVQNTMMYVGFANVEAAVGQVTYQSKILWTALFSVLIMGKRLSPNQWLSLVVLALGIVACQATGSGGKAAPPPPPETRHEQHKAGRPQGGHQHLSGHASGERAHGELRHRIPRSLAEVEAQGDPLIGIGALVLAALCTAFASVYFEKMLKGASKPSLWLRNIQLAVYCIAIATVGILLADDPRLKHEGWTYGFSALTWFCAFFQAVGGLLVAVTIKYADNILRGFAQALALIVGAVGSYLLFGFGLSPTFCGGVLLVIAAIFLYGSPLQTPAQRCDALCGRTTFQVAEESAMDHARLVGVSQLSEEFEELPPAAQQPKG